MQVCRCQMIKVRTIIKLGFLCLCIGAATACSSSCSSKSQGNKYTVTYLNGIYSIQGLPSGDLPVDEDDVVSISGTAIDCRPIVFDVQSNQIVSARYVIDMSCSKYWGYDDSDFIAQIKEELGWLAEGNVPGWVGSNITNSPLNYSDGSSKYRRITTSRGLYEIQLRVFDTDRYLYVDWYKS